MVFRLIVFDVEQGFCGFFKSPTNHTMMIDCGRTSEFSPVRYISDNELSGAQGYDGHRLTWLTITHPHDDHIEDIHNVAELCPPGIIYRQKYDWEDVKEANDADYENLEKYSKWQGTYTGTVTDPPDWGMDIKRFCLSPEEAARVNEAKYVNNSSVVTIATVEGSRYRAKFLFGGDMETDGWLQLLRKPDFRAAIKGVHFFIPSHHGHTSGFCSELFQAFGAKPLLNLVSVHSRDEHVDNRYSGEAFAQGVTLYAERRRMISTRCDGSIFITLDDEGAYNLWTENIEPNEKRKAVSPFWW
jgi:beta-lactamase superfamily II metal-dependent hydrolase